MGRVRRDGYYGKHKEFIRWECVPGDGEPPHYLSQELMAADPYRGTRGDGASQDGHRGDGRAGARQEGDGADGDGLAGRDGRAWLRAGGARGGNHRDGGRENGLVAADHDRFILGEKAQLLHEVAQCNLSMRAASIALRVAVFERREGRLPEGWEISRDGRLGRDWVAQYADILGERLLPSRWPHTVVVGSSAVRLKPINGAAAGAVGRRYYSLFAAVGCASDAASGELCAVAAFPKGDECAARDFFARLAGRPKVVVWDGDRALGDAASRCFPGARVYPSTLHMIARLREHLRRTWPYDPRRRIYEQLRVSGEDLFSDPERWREFMAVFERYEGGTHGAAPEQIRAGIASTRRWIERNASVIELLAGSAHQPRDARLVEDVLTTVRRRLGGRQRLMRNLPRLNSLLRLMAIELRGEADVDGWTQVLEEHHRARAGKPPPRRLVEGRLLKRA